jgi:ABC-type transport system involved in multi-copper enzyme maturation permease subunit
MSSSLGRIGAIARTTFIELARLRVFYVLVLFALVLIISSSFLARISFQQELQVAKDIALGAINFFLSMLAIVATAQLLPRDLEDRVIYSVLAKPVRRFEYILGKFFGVLGLLVISLVAMSILCLAVIHLREGAAVRETMQQLTQSPSEELDRALVGVHQAGANRDLVLALFLILTKAAVLVSLTLCISSFATSNIFTISAMVMVYLVGHLESIARDYWLHQRAAGWLVRVFLAAVAFFFPDLQAFNLSDQIIAGSSLSNLMLLKLLGFGVIYIVGYLVIAIAIFSQREL